MTELLEEILLISGKNLSDMPKPEPGQESQAIFRADQAALTTMSSTLIARQERENRPSYWAKEQMIKLRKELIEHVKG